VSQPALSTIWQTIADTIAAASGLTTVWKYQNANQPATDYVALSLGAFITDGFDYTQETPAPDWTALTTYAVGDRVLNDTGPLTYTCITAGESAASGGPTGTGSDITDGTAHWKFIPAGSEVAIAVGGVREVALQIEVWSAAVVEEIAKVTAVSACDAIVTKLRLPTARNALAVVGMTPFDPGPSNWIPSIVAARFRGRATSDVRCRIPARALTEYAGFIASLTATATVTGPGSTLTETITAP
jgi:hypothetical protein